MQSKRAAGKKEKTQKDGDKRKEAKKRGLDGGMKPPAPKPKKGKSSKAEIDDIFATGKDSAQKEIDRLASSNKCPIGDHALVAAKTPHEGYNCDVCNKKGLKMGIWMFGCRKCDWDCCRVCIDKYDAEEEKAYLKAVEAEEVAKQTAKEAKSGGAESSTTSWIDDGLGGKYDLEGYTGRTTNGGLRIFKGLHSRNKNGGDTPQCPIDCDCCF